MIFEYFRALRALLEQADQVIPSQTVPRMPTIRKLRLSIVSSCPCSANAAGAIPIVSALMEKGASMGTVLAFIMSEVQISLPEMIILHRVLKPKLLVIFITILEVAIILMGYLFSLRF